MTEYVLNALFGLVIGFVGGYAGISGAPFLVFLLGAFLGYSQHLAQGTVVAMMLGPMSLLGVWVMWDRVKPLLGYVAVGVLTYATFSYLGAAIAYLFSSETLRLLFAVLVLALGLRYVFQKNSAEGEDPVARPFLPFNLWTMALLGAVVGVIGGMFGIGAGVVMVPVLVKFFGVHKDDSRALSLAILVPPVSIGAVLQYHSHGDVKWMMVLVGFVAYFSSNYWGAKLGRSASPRRFQLVMGVLLILSALLFAWDLGGISW